MLEALKAKIKGAFNRLCCCYVLGYGVMLGCAVAMYYALMTTITGSPIAGHICDSPILYHRIIIRMIRCIFFAKFKKYFCQ